jgi:hypothetical protein
VAGGNHHAAVRLEQAHGMLPHGRGDDAEIDQIELDAQIVAGGRESASLDGGERQPGRPRIAREDEPRTRCRVDLQS